MRSVGVRSPCSGEGRSSKSQSLKTKHVSKRDDTWTKHMTRGICQSTCFSHLPAVESSSMSRPLPKPAGMFILRPRLGPPIPPVKEHVVRKDNQNNVVFNGYQNYVLNTWSTSHLTLKMTVEWWSCWTTTRKSSFAYCLSSYSRTFCPWANLHLPYSCRTSSSSSYRPCLTTSDPYLPSVPCLEQHVF